MEGKVNFTQETIQQTSYETMYLSNCFLHNHGHRVVLFLAMIREVFLNWSLVTSHTHNQSKDPEQMTVNAYSQVKLIYHFLQGKENIAEEKNVKVKE